MEINDLSLWRITLFEGCEILCPECNEWSIHTEWKKTSVYCEDCGEHTAIECPKCRVDFDHVWSPQFEVREPI